MAAVAVASSPAEGTPHYFTLTVTGQLVRVVLSPLGTSPVQVARYLRRLSGPLLDRFDVRLFVDPPAADEVFGPAAGAGWAWG